LELFFESSHDSSIHSFPLQLIVGAMIFSKKTRGPPFSGCYAIGALFCGALRGFEAATYGKGAATSRGQRARFFKGANRRALGRKQKNALDSDIQNFAKKLSGRPASGQTVLSVTTYSPPLRQCPTSVALAGEPHFSAGSRKNLLLAGGWMPFEAHWRGGSSQQRPKRFRPKGFKG